MELKEALVREQDSVVAKYHDFLLQYWKSKDSVFAFVEGIDDRQYYWPLFSSIYNGPCLHIYTAECKVNVLAIYNYIDWSRFSRQRVYFIVDKDLEDFVRLVTPVEENIYITECYSVENYLVCQESIVQVFNCIYRVQPLLGCDIDKLSKIIWNEMSKITELLRIVMAWVIALYRSGEYFPISNLNIDSLIEMNGYRLLSKAIDFESKLISKLCVVIGHDISGFQHTVDEIKSDLSILDCKRYIRGKNELSAFLRILSEIYSSIETILDGRRKYSNYSNLGMHNAVGLLAGKVPYPDSMRAFLK